MTAITLKRWPQLAPDAYEAASFRQHVACAVEYVVYAVRLPDGAIDDHHDLWAYVHQCGLFHEDPPGTTAKALYVASIASRVVYRSPHRWPFDAGLGLGSARRGTPTTVG